MCLHFLLFVLEDLISLLFFFNPGFQVMENLLQLLLLGGKPGSHLLRLGKELRLGLKLLREDVLLLQELQSQRAPGTVMLPLGPQQTVTRTTGPALDTEETEG